jgi:rare lipoprotein A
MDMIMKTLIASMIIIGTLVASTGRTVNVSWYGADYDGRRTASGSIFDHRKLTCASWDYKFGTKLKLTHGPRFVVVEVTDRGPAKRLLKTRQLDLSREAFSRLADPDAGILKNVKIEVMK